MKPFSYQLYSSREHPPLARTLRMLAATGYSQVEGYPAILDDAPAVRELLRQTGLRMPSLHWPLDALETSTDACVRLTALLDTSHVYAPYLAPAERPHDRAGWLQLGTRLERVAERLGENGIAFGWHNHDFEFVPLADGAQPMALLLEAAPRIGWQADLAWIARAAGDPAHWLTHWADRITSVHIKDRAPAGQYADEDGWADVGEGTLPWHTLWPLCQNTQAVSFVVEHDRPADDARFAARSLAALTALAEG
ncbi:MAG: sugar phosphate isomerase/epimerase [Pseudomonadota bacterium]